MPFKDVTERRKELVAGILEFVTPLGDVLEWCKASCGAGLTKQIQNPTTNSLRLGNAPHAYRTFSRGGDNITIDVGQTSSYNESSYDGESWNERWVWRTVCDCLQWELTLTVRACCFLFYACRQR